MQPSTMGVQPGGGGQVRNLLQRDSMTRFIVGDDRSRSTMFPERLDDYLAEDNPVRAIDVFVDELDLAKLGFGGVEPEATGRAAYHPATSLKICAYG
jgi:transposase